MAKINHNKDNNLIPFKMHPRVFAALGADLVTNDIVAVIELVKNSYDAFAKNVWIRFDEDEHSNKFIDIKDDGIGMNRETIENVWSLIATPFKHDNPYVMSGKKKRRVSGEKGLGRLSVARLGSGLEMFTKAEAESCWQVKVNWENISDANSLENCYISCAKCKGAILSGNTGTLLRISGLRSDWNKGMLSDLEDNLARLVSPFDNKKDFQIHLEDATSSDDKPLKIESPRFLSNPKYCITGEFNHDGYLICTYMFRSIDKKSSRTSESKMTWDQILHAAKDRREDVSQLSQEKAICGTFHYEIRAWDIDSPDILEISNNFDIGKSLVKRAIKAHKGISVYRDGILVLPKSDNAKDWLGLDFRRISRVGIRVSTNQIVGHVSISADENPDINDTSDRERLVDTKAVRDFEAILKAVIGILEYERDDDRIKREREKPLEDLFEKLSAEELLDEVMLIAEEGAPASKAVPVLRDFKKSLDQARKTIQERFIYYSRLATVGSIAQMLIHEIRNRTTSLGAFLRLIQKEFHPIPDNIGKSFSSAEKAIESLESLADTFAPLANRSFRRRRRDSNLKDSIEECLRLQGKIIDTMSITVNLAKSVDVRVAVDPGELDAVLLNLINNAVYWLSQSDAGKRKLEFRAQSIARGDRIKIRVDDTGPGISDDIVNKVFWPGVTKKPDGIGMGLTVASELVSEYGGQMSVEHPGTLGGASFIFDLPIKK
jgi:signal transduction histidine kinase